MSKISFIQLRKKSGHFINSSQPLQLKQTHWDAFYSHLASGDRYSEESLSHSHYQEWDVWGVLTCLVCFNWDQDLGFPWLNPQPVLSGFTGMFQVVLMLQGPLGFPFMFCIFPKLPLRHWKINGGLCDDELTRFCCSEASPWHFPSRLHSYVAYSAVLQRFLYCCTWSWSSMSFTVTSKI